MSDPTVDLDAARSALDDERQVLLGQLDELGEGADGPDYDENFADSGQVAAEQGEAKSLANRLREQLDDVQRALDKLDSGAYGRCEVCAAEISDARLEAMPATRYCIDHAG